MKRNISLKRAGALLLILVLCFSSLGMALPEGTTPEPSSSAVQADEATPDAAPTEEAAPTPTEGQEPAAEAGEVMLAVKGPLSIAPTLLAGGVQEENESDGQDGQDVIVYDPQPATEDDVWAAILLWAEADFAPEARPHWEYEVDVMPVGYTNEYVEGDAYFDAPYYTVAVKVTTLAAILWNNNTVIEADTTITFDADGEFTYQGTEYFLNADSTLSAEGDLTILLNNTSSVNLKKIWVEGDLDIRAGGTALRTLNVSSDDYNAIDVFGTLSIGTKVSLNAESNVDGCYAVYAGSIHVDEGRLAGVGKECGINAGDITIENGGVLEGSGDFGVYVSSISINDGTLTGTGGDYGVLAYAIQMNGGAVTGKGEYLGVYAYNITVGGDARLEGEATEEWSSGVCVIGTLNVSDGILNGKGGFYGIEGYIIRVSEGGQITGTATMEDSEEGASSGVRTAYIEVVGSGSRVDGVGGDCGVMAEAMGLPTLRIARLEGIVVENDAILTGEGGMYGVWVKYTDSTAILVQGNGTLTGKAPHFGVYAEGPVEADDGGTIKGVATAANRIYNDGDQDYDTSAVMAEFPDTIRAQNGGLIWEDYPNIQLAFNDTTPVYPYSNGVNINSISNYTWTPSLAADASGLLATQGYTGVQDITGIRSGDASSGEAVTLDDTSTHKITFLGTLSGPMPATYTVIYDANGGTGSHSVAGIAPGTAHIILDTNAAGISRTGHTFTGWNTAADGTGTNYSAGEALTVDSDVTLYAVWEAVLPATVTYTITASAGAHGNISPSGKTEVSEGSDITFTITPASGYVIDALTVDGKEATATDNKYTFKNVQSDHTIHVTFKESSSLPQTGDDSNLWLWLALAAASTAGVCVLVWRKRRNV